MARTTAKLKIPQNAMQLGTIQLQSGSYVAMGVVGPVKPPPNPPIHEGDFLNLGYQPVEGSLPTNLNLTAAPPPMQLLPNAGSDLRQVPVGNPPIPPIPPIIPIPPWVVYVMWKLVSNLVTQVGSSGHGIRFQPKELEKILTSTLSDTSSQLATHYPEYAGDFKQLGRLQVKLVKV